MEINRAKSDFCLRQIRTGIRENLTGGPDVEEQDPGVGEEPAERMRTGATLVQMESAKWLRPIPLI